MVGELLHGYKREIHIDKLTIVNHKLSMVKLGLVASMDGLVMTNLPFVGKPFLYGISKTDQCFFSKAITEAELTTISRLWPPPIMTSDHPLLVGNC